MPNFDKLPNFYVIGAGKAGTTTLYDLLRQHPQVYMPLTKEPRFFDQDEHFALGIEWYEETYFADAGGYPARGEATPYYLYRSEKVAPRLKELYGGREVRFVVIFRDPVERARSTHSMVVREGREDLPFGKALAVEGERLKQGLEDYGYFEGGLYATQLRPFLELFPRERFLFLFLEDLSSDPAGVAARAFGFLGVDESVEVWKTVSNAASVPRSETVHKLLYERSFVKEALKPLLPGSLRWIIKTRLMDLNRRRMAHPPIDEDLDLALRRRYRDEVLGLQDITGRDLSHWMVEE